ncbi:TonB-dependent siderophore receptor [Algibacter sp. L4_22]|uniref:TonB-dependent receptor plug domain-containing protein n=1 Tax=Algibacter sp. L4_22 TaxID=2942477 RepID=UPI00201B90A6|nr:TonB-dependent receptor [Algibacter sp. L4_22]MCL5129140.1 TonB-dependent receptor [Algibacter sp. L4_22]
MKNRLSIFILNLLLVLLSGHLFAQDTSVYENMSLDEILNIDVVITASKQPEDLFETPLSVTIISREDIDNAGATSIMEALRLSQGLIVREITPGNFDVQIRGFDDITKNAYVSLPYNTTILVMIDNRIVYDYYSGGTLWETLPIDINDIERIEIVRGPASALYGPNAATGVINIITSHSKVKGLNIFASGKIGNANTKIANANIGYNWNNQTSLTLTGNFTVRDRFDNMYYNWWDEEYTQLEDMHMMMEIEKDPNTHEIWTYQDFSEAVSSEYNTEQSLQKRAANLFFSHEFNENTNVNLSFGGQKSESQKIGFLNFATPLSQYESQSFYIDNKFKINNFYGQWNISQGEVLGNSFNTFEFDNLDANLEYLFRYKNLSLRPGLSYKRSSYNSPVTYDEVFDLSKLNYEIKDEPRKFISYSGSMLADWKLSSKLRMIAGFRVDKFNINKHHFVNFELASTYRLNKNNLLRAVISRANRSPSFYDTFINTKMNFYYGLETETNVNPVYVPVEQYIKADRDQKYPTNSSLELSWRSKLSSKLNIDIEVFFQKSDNLLASIEYREINSEVQLNNENEVETVLSVSGSALMSFENYDYGSSQLGASFMLNYSPNSKLDCKLYGTLQKTFLNDNTEFEINTTDTKLSLNPETNILSTTAYSNLNMTLLSDELTPSLYGGFLLNYKPNNKLNLNINGYVYSKQVFEAMPIDNVISDYTGIYHRKTAKIKANSIINSKVSYNILKKTEVNISIKNMLGKHREYGFADTIGTSFLVGFQWEY